MNDGIIEVIDKNLNKEEFKIDLPQRFKNINKYRFNKNVPLEEETILINIEVGNEEEKKDILAKISLSESKPTVQVIQEGKKEDILNVDYKSGEVFTRSYVNDKTTINIRNLNNLKVENTFTLENDDPIYFVDHKND